MARTGLALLTIFGFIAAATLPGCTGGCYEAADPVTTVPATDCLTLYAGQTATDPTVCADPELTIQNACADVLTLPAYMAGGPSIVVAAGARSIYNLTRITGVPGITVTKRGDARDYVISATLGATPVAIDFSVHDR